MRRETFSVVLEFLGLLRLLRGLIVVRRKLKSGLCSSMSIEDTAGDQEKNIVGVVT